MLLTSLHPLRWACSTCSRGLRVPKKSPLKPSGSFRLAYSTSPDLKAVTDLNRTRNIGIIAHIDAGKTTTTERMLYYSGFTRRIGDVDDGSTVTDFLPAERARGITIQSAAITFHWPPESSAGITPEDLQRDGLPRAVLPHTINLIDTPGHADFTFEVLRSLRILDGAVCILDGVAGVEAQTEQVWHQASTYSIPRIAYVNKLDREGAAFGRTVKEIGSRLGGWPAVCQIPWFEGIDGKFRGIGDVIALQGFHWTEGGDGKQISVSRLSDLEQKDTQFAEELKRARVALVELLSDHDDNMVESFLEHNEDHLAVKPIEIWESLRRCLLVQDGRVIPTFAGASFKNIGVQPLLDAVVNLLPSPAERPDPEVSVGSTKVALQDLLSGKQVVAPTDQATKHKHKKKHATETKSALQKLDSCALAFKVVNDPKRGVLVYVRVYSGTLNRNALLFNTNLDVSERAPRLLKMYANDAIEVQSIPSGHIGVIAGLKFARTGDTLVSFTGNRQTAPEPLNTLQLRPIDVPPPVFYTSVEPHSLSEEKNLQESLALLLREDPSLHITVDEDSGQTVLSGMGELHLEIASDRLVKDFKAKASMGNIEIGYRECISEASPPVSRVFDKEVAGRKGKAGCTARVEPLYEDEKVVNLEDLDILITEKRDGNRITIQAPGLASTKEKANELSTVLPPNLSPSIIQTSMYNGCLAALTRGPKHSFPVHSVNVTLTFDINDHLFGSESSPSAISAAARLATQSALKEVSSSASLMEPVMNVAISVQESNLGAVVHDISSARGGHIVSLDDDSASTDTPTDLPPIDVSKIYAPRDPFSPASSPGVGLTAAASNQSRTITAKVPLKEMVGYLKHLRSLTGGRGTFVMSVDRFEKMSSQREKVALAEMRGL